MTHRFIIPRTPWMLELHHREITQWCVENRISPRRLRTGILNREGKLADLHEYHPPPVTTVWVVEIDDPVEATAFKLRWG